MTPPLRPHYDVVFVGGGLANGLAALTLRRKRPELSLLVVESGSALGGERTWSFHESDLEAEPAALVAPMVSARWPGYDVRFPSYARRFAGGYASIRSADFHRAVSGIPGLDVALGRRARELEAGSIVLDGDQKISGCVIDGRGWSGGDAESLGYQKFLGQDLRLSAPHGLDRPVLMDATVPQVDGFRFIYVLPWSADRILVEDTHYSDTPEIDGPLYRAEIAAYAARRGWQIAGVEREEIGSLAIPLEGESPARNAPTAASGGRAGLFHATTGYSLPAALRFADALARRPDFDPRRVAAWSREYASRHWNKESFFRMLNRLLFRAAAPERRYRVLERFYRRPRPLIERFYAGRLAPFDAARLLTGLPPVPLRKALSCFRPKQPLRTAA